MKTVMKPTISCLLKLTCLFFLLIPQFVLGSGSQEINIRLALHENKNIYHNDDPIFIDVKTIKLISQDQDIYINEGFSSQNFHFKIRLIDPTGRLVIPKRRELKDQGHVYPLLPFALHNGVPIRLAPCEIFKKRSLGPKEIRKIFDPKDLKLPGLYSAQIEVSAMTFEEGTCNVDAPRWVGLINSNIVSFYVTNTKNEAEVIPKIWERSWIKNSSTEDGYVQFRIKCEDITVPNDANGIQAYLNYNQKLLDAKMEGNWLYARGKESNCVQSLRLRQGKRINWIAVTFRLNNGRFCGASKMGILSNDGKRIEFE